MSLKNAIKAIREIRAGEWVPVWNPYRREHLTAVRYDFELWLGNGPCFCEISHANPWWVFSDSGQPPRFGLVWRHLVWWAAARRLKLDADRNYSMEGNPN